MRGRIAAQMAARHHIAGIADVEMREGKETGRRAIGGPVHALDQAAAILPGFPVVQRADLDVDGAMRNAARHELAAAHGLHLHRPPDPRTDLADAVDGIEVGIDVVGAHVDGQMHIAEARLREVVDQRRGQIIAIGIDQDLRPGQGRTGLRNARDNAAVGQRLVIMAEHQRAGKADGREVADDARVERLRHPHIRAEAVARRIGAIAAAPVAVGMGLHLNALHIAAEQRAGAVGVGEAGKGGGSEIHQEKALDRQSGYPRPMQVTLATARVARSRPFTALPGATASPASGL